MDAKSRETLIGMLFTARLEARQINLPRSLVPPTRDAGIDVHNAVSARLINEGWEPLGWKIAGTTAAMQGKFGTAEPIYGRTFRRFACSSPARLPYGELLDPLVECEFFVTLKKDLPPRKFEWTWDEVLDAVGSVHAGIEVAECRYPMDKLPGTPGILADGSASGRYIFGEAIKDWRSGLEKMEVVLEMDGKRRRFGKGADVMGHPLRPLLWLSNERSRWGDGLKSGETISTGSMTGMFHVKDAGHSVKAVFGGTIAVEVAFDWGMGVTDDLSICSMVRI